jgi:hypothetical protein
MKSNNSARHLLILPMPWWGSILLAVFCYCGLKYGAPQLHFTDPTLQQLAQAAPSFAPILAIPLLLLAAKQLYDTDLPNAKDDRDEEPPVQ